MAEMRWPRIDINLAASPELVDEWLSCAVQSRLTAAHPPDEVAGDDIDVIIEGYSETLGYKDWDIAANCSPAQPWTVAEADSDTRVAGDGSTLTSGITSGQTSWSVTNTSTVTQWTTDAAHFPLDINIGGEKITLSGISGTGTTQTFTASTRAVNGVTKAHSAGTSADVWQPAVAAL